MESNQQSRHQRLSSSLSSLSLDTSENKYQQQQLFRKNYVSFFFSSSSSSFQSKQLNIGGIFTFQFLFVMFFRLVCLLLLLLVVTCNLIKLHYHFNDFLLLFCFVVQIQSHHYYVTFDEELFWKLMIENAIQTEKQT